MRKKYWEDANFRSTREKHVGKKGTFKELKGGPEGYGKKESAWNEFGEVGGGQIM